MCCLQPGQDALKTGLDSGAGAASNRNFFQSKKGGWGPVTNWRFAPSLYDAESRVPPRDSPRFAGGRKPRSRYWAIPALSVYQNRDFRQGEHHQSLCQSQLSQQGRQLGPARETHLMRFHSGNAVPSAVGIRRVQFGFCFKDLGESSSVGGCTQHACTGFAMLPWSSATGGTANGKQR